ncbi:MAG TPA: nuclear transport factor 2 family protein [Thermodesulfobacteriota bacterium]|nr:nuclear transport factor 2 family protein [Thermodesulfobacteriota bacterium]
MKKSIKYVVLTLLFALPILSCGNADNNDIKKVLSDRQTAFETKDLQLYLSCISPDYSQKAEDSVIGIEELSKNFQTNTTVFDTLKITRKDISIYMKGQGIAEVYQKSLFNLKIESQSSKFKTVEKMLFEKKGGNWKIVKESELDLFRGFVFGSK